MLKAPLARVGLSSLLIGAILAPPRRALGATDEEKVACADSYTEGQRLRREGALRAAREKLRFCTREACSKLQADCVQWVGELDRAIPSVVLRAHDEQGRDLPDTRVQADGVPLVERLDGRSLEMDPGTHRFRFVHAGVSPGDVEVVLGEGEKARNIVVELRSPSPPAAPKLESTRPIPWPAYVLGGVGAVGLASFTYFGLTGRAGYFDLEKCGRFCSSSDVNATRDKLLIADISLGVSILALAAAAYVVLTRPTVIVQPRAQAGLVTLPFVGTTF